MRTAWMTLVLAAAVAGCSQQTSGPESSNDESAMHGWARARTAIEPGSYAMGKALLRIEPRPADAIYASFYGVEPWPVQGFVDVPFFSRGKGQIEWGCPVTLAMERGALHATADAGTRCFGGKGIDLFLARRVPTNLEGKYDCGFGDVTIARATFEGAHVRIAARGEAAQELDLPFSLEATDLESSEASILSVGADTIAFHQGPRSAWCGRK